MAINAIGGALGSGCGKALEIAWNGGFDEGSLGEILVDMAWGGAFGAVGGLMEDPVKSINPKKLLKEATNFVSNAAESLFGGICEWVEQTLVEGYVDFVT